MRKERPSASSEKSPDGVRERERPWQGLAAIETKELVQVRRDPLTLFFMLMIPANQLTLFGFALDTTVEHIPMAVLDMDGHRRSDEFVEALEKTRSFRVVERARAGRTCASGWPVWRWSGW